MKFVPEKARAAGFTLIEVLITVVILGLLLAVAVPNYTESVKRTARNEARAVMLENMAWMEQRFTVNNSYGNSAPTLPYAQSPKKGDAKYNIKISEKDGSKMTPTSYVLIAEPVKTEPKCGTFTIDNTGKRGLEGSHSMTVEECWAGK